MNYLVNVRKNGSQSNECKCAQDKIKFQKGEIVRGEIWAIQILQIQQQPS